MMKPSAGHDRHLDTLTLVILASDNGADLLRLIDSIQAERLAGRIALVVTDQRGSRAQDRAEDAGISTLYHPFDWYRDTGRSAADYDHDLAEIIAAHAPDRVLLSGWSRPLSDAFVSRYRPQTLVDFLART